MALARRRLPARVAAPAAPRLATIAPRDRTEPPTPPPLWLALRFPGFAEQVFAAADAAAAFAVVEGEGARRRVIARNAAAAQHGVRCGHSVAAALALVPGLTLAPRDAERETAALTRLAAWGQQFTPTVSLAPPDSLLLEVRGSLTLFGGLETLIAWVTAALDPLGYRALLAAAPTPNAALWFARAGVPARIEDPAALAGPLGALPLSAAGWAPERIAALEGLGVHALRDLSRLPRDGLARRYGAALRREFDQALGRAPDPRPAFVPPLRFVGAIELSHETVARDWLGHAAGRLIAELCGGLAARGMGVRRLRLELRHRAPPHGEVVLGLLAPSRDAAHLDRLLAERLARVALDGPVRAVALEALEVEPLGAAALELFSENGSVRAGSNGGACGGGGALIEVLAARLGAEAVFGLAGVADHRPERAWQKSGVGVEFISRRIYGVSEGCPNPGPRPIWLLAEPRPLAALRGAPRLRGRPLELVSGPERIESGWWDGGDVIRDYYLARAGDGARLWVFRTRHRPATWFVHGVFA